MNIIRLLALFVAAAGMLACQKQARPIPDASAIRPTSSPTARIQTFTLNREQARYVATVINFIEAFNAGQLDAALGVLDENAALSDCDYRAREAVDLRGRKSIGEWLRSRIADRDRLEVDAVFNENPEGGPVVGIRYARRSSDTLRKLGFPDGIVPPNAKVVFTVSGDRIRAYANASVGPPDACKLTR